MSTTGQLGEQIVAKEYARLGYKIVERNYIFPKGKRTGEIDLVCSKGQELVFVEVKVRNTQTFGDSFEAVDQNKQARLIKTAKLYLQIHPQYQDYDYRIDVVAVTIDKSGESVKILTNAIEDSD